MLDAQESEHCKIWKVKQNITPVLLGCNTNIAYFKAVLLAAYICKDEHKVCDKFVLNINISKLMPNPLEMYQLVPLVTQVTKG